MRTGQTKRCVGPTALGYDPGTKAWWDAAVRINYREVRLRLTWARRWMARLHEHLTLPQRSRSQRKLRILLEAVCDCLTQAQFWREQASNTRVARATAIHYLGALKQP